MSALTQPMPGQLEAIANQLQAGYGQPASSYLSMFKNIYK
jgi:hypothetical protein